MGYHLSEDICRKWCMLLRICREKGLNTKYKLLYKCIFLLADYDIFAANMDVYKIS